MGYRRWNSRCKNFLYSCSQSTSAQHVSSPTEQFSASLQRQLLSFSSVAFQHDLPGDGVRCHTLRPQSRKIAPPLQRAATSQRSPGLLTNWLKTGGSPGPLFRFGNLLEHSEFWETLYLLLPVHYKGYNEQAGGGDAQGGRGTGVHTLHPTPSPHGCVPNLDALSARGSRD